MRVPRDYGLGPEVTGGVRDAITPARSSPVGVKGSPTLPLLPDLDSNQEMHRCTRINSPPRCQLRSTEESVCAATKLQRSCTR